jgi:hypothetical protein
MIRGAQTSVVPSIGYAITLSRGGKMSLPVSPSSYIYSHFKHVSGVPAPDGTRGVTINKLKVLDVLIEQLARMKQKPGPSLSPSGASSDERIDALIEQYETQLRAATASAEAAAVPYGAPKTVPTGAVFNLVA